MEKQTGKEKCDKCRHDNYEPEDDPCNNCVDGDKSKNLILPEFQGKANCVCKECEP